MRIWCTASGSSSRTALVETCETVLVLAKGGDDCPSDRHQDARSAEQALAALARADGTRRVDAYAFGALRMIRRDSSAADNKAARRAAGA